MGCGCTASLSSRDVSVEVINTIDRPAVTTIAPAAAATAESLFFFTTENQGVAVNASLFLQLTNPAGSGRNLHIARIAGTAASTNTVVTLIQNGSFVAAGTALTPVNANFGSAVTSVATAKFVNLLALAVGGVIFQHYFQPAAGGIVVPEYDGRIVMPPGTTFVIRLINNQAGNNQLSLNIGFWETIV